MVDNNDKYKGVKGAGDVPPQVIEELHRVLDSAQSRPSENISGARKARSEGLDDVARKSGI